MSTLGGIEICGEDAAEMMNRMYTFAFKKTAGWQNKVRGFNQ